MAWPATDNFDSYSNGSLNGGAGGSGWASNWANVVGDIFTVQGTTVYQGSKAIEFTGVSGSDAIKRTVSALSGTTNEIVLAVRRATGSLANMQYVFFAGASFRGQIQINGTKIFLATGGGTRDIVASAAADTWYLIVVDIDITNSQWRGKEFGGSYTSYLALDGSGGIDTVQPAPDTGHHGFFDDIRPLASAGPANVKKYMGVAQASIKKASSVALASVKKIEGVA